MNDLQIKQAAETGLGTGLDQVDRLTLERLSAADAPAIRDHLKRLGEFDRYSRYFSAMSDDGIERYVDGLDWSRMLATGLYRNDTLIGMAELGWVETPAEPPVAELAVTVDQAYRHRGIGTWLVSAAIECGRKSGIGHIEASWIGGNDSIAKIMHRLDAQVWLNGSHWRGIAALA
jgi:GNAT superfamily N-acetyltransferase